MYDIWKTCLNIHSFVYNIYIEIMMQISIKFVHIYGYNWL